MIKQGSDNLRELIRVLSILEKNDASCCGVTISQCHAIVEIGRVIKISLIDLANLLGLDKSTMSRTISNLVNDGLVIRDVDAKNRRYVDIQLTDKGQEVYKGIEESMYRYYANVFAAIPEDKRDQVIESLEILTHAVKNTNYC